MSSRMSWVPGVTANLKLWKINRRVTIAPTSEEIQEARDMFDRFLSGYKATEDLTEVSHYGGGEVECAIFKYTDNFQLNGLILVGDVFVEMKFVLKGITDVARAERYACNLVTTLTSMGLDYDAVALDIPEEGNIDDTELRTKVSRLLTHTEDLEAINTSENSKKVTSGELLKGFDTVPKADWYSGKDDRTTYRYLRHSDTHPWGATQINYGLEDGKTNHEGSRSAYFRRLKLLGKQGSFTKYPQLLGLIPRGNVEAIACKKIKEDGTYTNYALMFRVGRLVLEMSSTDEDFITSEVLELLDLPIIKQATMPYQLYSSFLSTDTAGKPTRMLMSAPERAILGVPLSVWIEDAKVLADLLEQEEKLKNKQEENIVEGEFTEVEDTNNE